jgi:hypothetical protein
MTRRTAVVLLFVNVACASVLTTVVGPTYLQPLPMWAKLLLIVAGTVFIGTIATYGRIHARRATN